MLTFQKIRVASTMGWAFVRLVRDPLCDLSPVFRLVDSINQDDYVREVEQWFEAHGVEAMHTRPRLGHVDVDALAALPEGTLGHAFATFLRDNDLDVSALPVLEEDNPGRYISAHLYETHDIWHVVTGFGPDVAGEVGLQTFYLAQFPSKLPLVLLPAALLNVFLFAPEDARRRMNAIARGWILGRRADQLFGVDWKTMWELPLSEVRRALRIDLDGLTAEVWDEQARHAA